MKISSIFGILSADFATGMKNIRDVILYPRTPGKL